MNNADEDKLETLLRKVTSPLSSTLEAFGTKLDNHRTEMAANVAEIKTDIRYLKENQKEAWEQIDKVRDKWPVVEQLLRKDEITSSFKLNKTSVPPTSPAGQPVMKLGTISSWCIRLAPIILAAALGLIGLGVYFASGSTDEATATMRAIRAIADTNTKISGELKKIQTEIDDAGVQR